MVGGMPGLKGTQRLKAEFAHQCNAIGIGGRATHNPAAHERASQLKSLLKQVELDATNTAGR